MENKAPRTLLVLKPGSFGDILHTLPAVARLKAAWPECRISWLANTEWVPLLAGNPDVDEVIEFPRREFRGWGGMWKAVKWSRTTMAGRRPDLALDFQGLLRSALIGRASGTRVLQGLDDAREGARYFYHRVIASPAQPIHAVERYLALANAALAESGESDVSRTNTALSFPLPVGQAPGTDFELNGDFLLIHPYSRGYGKSLDQSQIKHLLRKIRNRQIVLVGRGNASIGNASDQCLNLVNRTTIPELVWLVRRALSVISVDSGPSHLAAALGKPMIAIHAWSDPRRVGPYHPDAWVWKNGELSQMRHLAAMSSSFFDPNPLRLGEADLDAIARLATSPSDFSA